MKHLSIISKKPVLADTTTSGIDVSTLITFIVAVLEAFKPLLVAKEDATTS